VRITPVAINEEIKLLSSYAGEDSTKCVLKNIIHVSDVVFNNGCRASSWRQMHGDITYLVIDLFDAKLTYVTCNRSGVYENNVTYSVNSRLFIHCSNVFILCKISKSPRRRRQTMKKLATLIKT